MSFELYFGLSKILIIYNLVQILAVSEIERSRELKCDVITEY